MNRLHKIKFILNRSFVKNVENVQRKLRYPKTIIFGSTSVVSIFMTYFIHNKWKDTKCLTFKSHILRSSDNFIYNNENSNKQEAHKKSDNLDKKVNMQEQEVKTDQKQVEKEKQQPIEILEPKPVEEIVYFDKNQKLELPNQIPYLIIGAGIAGLSAARAIRASDPFAKVLIINAEGESPGKYNNVNYPPYRRIMLSKYIWRRAADNLNTFLDSTGDVKNSSLLYLEPDSFFVDATKLNQCNYGGVSLLNGHKVINLDPDNKTITLEGIEQKISYQTCLLAVGSRPRRLEYLEKANNNERDLYSEGMVSYFRNINDFRKLSDKVNELQVEGNTGKILIIGSGLLGTELTTSLGRIAREKGNLEIIEAFREKSHLTHILPNALSEYILNSIKRFKVNVLPNTEAISVDDMSGNKMRVTLKSLNGDLYSNENIELDNIDHIVIAAGVVPCTDLAHGARLELDGINGGFMVNSELQARESLFVAGDACSFYDPELGRRRVEHWNHAEESGSVAGHNMAAHVLSKNKSNLKDVPDKDKLAVDITKPRIYDFQCAFTFKLSMYKMMEALGRIDSSLETRVFLANEMWDQNYDIEDDTTNNNNNNSNTTSSVLEPLDMPGVVLYLHQRRIVGVLLWNCDDDLIIDTDLPSPLRMNIARKVLADRHVVVNNEDILRQIAANFDLSFYVNSQVRSLEKFNSTKINEDEKDSEIEKENVTS